MSGSITGNSIRAIAAMADQTVPYINELDSDGTQASLGGTIAAETYLKIDTVAGSAPATDLFVPGNISFLENVSDTSPIIGSAADAAAGMMVYQGDSAGQTFYAGAGTVDALFTGYGNTFATNSTGGTYVVSAGLASAATSDQTLASAPATQLGNTVVVAAGDASISAGLGYNSIFLGTGNALVANEGHDSIIGGSGNAVIDGAGQATVFAGQGSTEYDGQGGTAIIIGSQSSTVSGALNALTAYGGTGSVTVYGGTGTESAYGGTAGNNVLVSGSANSTLVSGGSNNLLVATGSGTTNIVAGAGNDTLYAGGASGVTNVFLGAGNDTLVAGTGTEYIQFGTGSSTVFGSSGHDVYGIVNATDTGTNLVLGFNAAQDFFHLQGFDSSVTAASVLASDVTVTGGSTFLKIPTTGFTIEFYNTTNITASNFV